jgi:N-acetylmuramoyl-L-alanine amidase-like
MKNLVSGSVARDSTVSRRNVLHLITGAALALGARPALAGEKRIDKLIIEARKYPTISERINFVSAALRGTRYRAYTLIGGPHRPEKFVVRDDAFDCVTYCETVLAAARARSPEEFDGLLRKIRYHNGVVEWRERNHYFFDWCQRNVDNGLCRWLDMAGAVNIHKSCDSQKGLGTRRFTMRVIPRAVFLANQSLLQAGDIIGFVSRRSDLDYFHAGLIAFGHDNTLLLRHASESDHRVLDERMGYFLAHWHVRYVSLLRPLEPPAVA